MSTSGTCAIIQTSFDLPLHITCALQLEQAPENSSSPTSSPLLEPSLLSDLPTLSPLDDPSVPLSSTIADTLGSVPVPTQENGSIASKDRRRVRRNQSANISQKKKREKQSQAVDAYIRARPNPRLVKRSSAVQCATETANIPVASTGFIALNQGRNSRKEYKLEELVGENSKFHFKLLKVQSGSTPIVDANNHIVGVVATHPNDDHWQELQQQAADALESRRSRCHIPSQDRFHRRGAFASLRCGVSHGGGQTKPGNLQNHKDNEEVLAELNALEPFKRFAGFATSVMFTWASSLYGYYAATLDKLHKQQPELIRIFAFSIFSAVSYNFGPRTVCFQHKDFANLSFGWCAVTALGNFDYMKGGHLILWELQLVIEFPPGCTILFPSALITHSNVTVSKHERRYSFVQYTAGGIFRWVDNNCMKREQYLATLSPNDVIEDAVKSSNRWKFGLSLLPVRT